MRDSTVDLTLPEMTINISNFYPFKRKKAVGDERWYEKISMRYTGNLTNKAVSVKEDKLLHTSLTKTGTMVCRTPFPSLPALPRLIT